MHSEEFQKKAVDFVKSSGWDMVSCKMVHEVSKFNLADSAEEGSASLKITGYLSTFHNTDRQNDIILQGAFDSTLKGLESLPMLVDHSNKVNSHVGSWSNFRVDAKGLLADGVIIRSENTEHIQALIKGGHINTLSIGGVFKYANNGNASKDGTFSVEKIALLECSIVSVPANPLARFEMKSFFNEPKCPEVPEEKSQGLVPEENSGRVVDQKEIERKIKKINLRLGVFK